MTSVQPIRDTRLEELLKPCHVEDFLAYTWGKASKHIPGWAGKFSHLISWSCLNEILSRHRLDFPRLRLTRDGEVLPASSYIRYKAGRNKKVSIPRLLPVELNNQLRTGATLVLDAVDELFTPIEELAEDLERVFHEHIQINAYAGWRTSRGFDLHWDDHDVFVLQVIGKKRWSVYGMTTQHPLPVNRGSNAKPAGPPLWEDTLQTGDVLYIPRGWWHVAVPLDEPTLHLTVGIHSRTGLDLLRWLADRMEGNELFRKDLPRFAERDKRAEHVGRLREELFSEWEAGMLERYYSDWDGRADPRTRFSLPSSAMPDVIPESMTARLRWTAPRPYEVSCEDGVLAFACIGKRWRFAEAARVILDPLAERTCSVAELYEASRGILPEETVRALLTELVLNGLVALADS